MTLQELKAVALIIKNATTASENTAVRFGTMFDDILNYISESDATLLQLIQSNPSGPGGSSFGGIPITTTEILDATATPNGYPVQLDENYGIFNTDHFALLVLATNDAGGAVQIAYYWDGTNKIMVRSGEANAYGEWESIGGANVDLSSYETIVNNDIKLAEKVSKITLQSIDNQPEGSYPIGSKYYNFSDKYIYEVIDTGQGDLQWDLFYLPENGIIYLFDGKNYVWTGVDLIDQTNVIESLFIDGKAVPIISKNMEIVLDSSLEYKQVDGVFTFSLSQEYKDLISLAL